jgi:hypothetical protein
VRTIGLLDWENGRHYRSDRIYCDRARDQAALRVVYTPHSKVYHFLQRSTADLREQRGGEYQEICVENRWNGRPPPTLALPAPEAQITEAILGRRGASRAGSFERFTDLAPLTEAQTETVREFTKLYCDLWNHGRPGGRGTMSLGWLGTLVMALTRIMTRQLTTTESPECQAFWLLMLPALLYHFARSPRGLWVFVAFLAICADFERIAAKDEQLAHGEGYDFNYVLDSGGGTLALAARVKDPASGRVMEVRTTEPAVQFYTGNHMPKTIVGKGKKTYGFRQGFCLETQHFPDSPNHANFPSTVLKPGQKYATTTVYKFSAK